MSRKFVLATRNFGKIAEFQRMMQGYGSEIEVLGLREFPDLPDVAETGLTLQANALLKAREVAEFTHLPALADDSGIFINALNGDPGIFSARWAGSHGDDAANIRKVLGQLSELEKVGPISREASFRCAVALHFPKGSARAGLEIVELGEMQGRIIDEPRGDFGFGYDPIFLPDGFDCTSAELTSVEKDAISHRGKALRLIVPRLNELL